MADNHKISEYFKCDDNNKEIIKGNIDLNSISSKISKIHNPFKSLNELWTEDSLQNEQISNLNAPDSQQIKVFPISINEETHNGESVVKFNANKHKKYYEKPNIKMVGKIKYRQTSTNKDLIYPVYNDKLVFKDLSESYLQDEVYDDGEDTDEETIKSDFDFQLNDLMNFIKIMYYKDVNGKYHNQQNSCLISRPILFESDNNEYIKTNYKRNEKIK